MVWEVTEGDELVLDDVLALDVDAPVDDESSESSDPLDVELLLAFCAVELAAAVEVVTVPCPSCQASTPPSESIAATLRAVAALRARAARGFRRGRAVPPRVAGVGVGEGVCSSMTMNVRTGRERAARGG